MCFCKLREPSGLVGPAVVCLATAAQLPLTIHFLRLCHARREPGAPDGHNCMLREVYRLHRLC